MKPWLQGALVWTALLGTAWWLPGAVWKSAPAPPFPVSFLLPGTLALTAIAVASSWSVRHWGPRASRSQVLSLWEAVPDLLWGAAILALRPGAWGPPGYGTWFLALVVAVLPGEIRWLSSALPRERPFPAAWGLGALTPWRAGALRRLLPEWLAARLPFWVTSTLVLERMLNVRGLGSDWMDRVATRNHGGLVLWVMAFALAWGLLHRLQKKYT